MSVPQTNTRVQAGALLPDMPGTAYQAFPYPVPSPLTFASTATWGSDFLPGVLKPAANFASSLPGWDLVRAPTIQVAGVWLFQETAEALQRAHRRPSPVERARAAVSRGSTTVRVGNSQLKMRSRGGIALQEQFSLFAANFVQWAAVWLQKRVVHDTSAFDEALTRVKTMVRVAANTSAWLVEQEGDLLVRFDDSGAYPGVELCLSGAWRTRPLLLSQKKVQKFDFRDAFASGCT